MFTDIHSHIIPFVDDGTSNYEDAVRMLKEETKNNVDKIILTPHYHKSVFETSQGIIKFEFENLKKKINEENLNIKLYLGQEIYVSKRINIIDKLENNEVLTMNGTKYILVEFSTKDEYDVCELVYTLGLRGYIPIIAHIERYPYLRELETIEEIKRLGGLLQINASSLTGKEGATCKKVAIALLKKGFVDFVSSDIHSFRENEMQKVYNFICKKFGVTYAEQLFYLNANRIIETKEE